MDIDVASLRIIHYPDPRLRKMCKPVESFDASLPQLAERMFELMRADEGIGLAAPQVGLAIRLFVCNITGEPKDDLVVINPRLSDFGDSDQSEEGCLSIPDVRGTFLRYMSCKLSAQDISGKTFEMVGSDLSARCWQHECDHLDGKLILDRFSEADKIANRRKLKQLEADFKAPRGAKA